MIVRTCLLLCLITFGSQALAIEKLGYRVIWKEDRIEVRQYGAHFVSTVAVDAAFEDAGRRERVASHPRGYSWRRLHAHFTQQPLVSAHAIQTQPGQHKEAGAISEN